MPDPKEQFSDLLFPVNGIDLAAGFQRQRQGTTRAGVNVRAFEPLTERMRGGRRSGLSKYVAGQLPLGAHLVQGLNVLVDPQGTALLANFNFNPPVIPDPSTPFNPDGSRRIPIGQQIPVGGTGATPNNVVPMSPGTVNPPHIKFVQSNAASQDLFGAAAGSASVSFTSSVTSGNLLLAAANSHSNAATMTITDSQGNTWTQANGYSANGGISTVSLWYAFANTSGANAVTATPSDVTDFSTIAVLEYSGVTHTSPVDGTSTHFANSTNFTTGSVSVGTVGEAIIGVFTQDNTVFANFTAGSGFILRASLQATFDHGGIWVVDMLGASASAAATGTLDSGGDDYVAIGASFKPA